MTRWQRWSMEGPYKLTDTVIDREVTKTSPGNYGLGHTNDGGGFTVKYVGRSDVDVNDRLKDWVGSYKEFKFSCAGTPKAAFEKECRNYHDFGGREKLDNEQHPARPSGTGWTCPVCTILE